MKRLLVAAALLLLVCRPAGAVGFQWASAPDADQAPLQVAIWYPSTDKPADTDFGPFEMQVAVNGSVAGERHPLIVMSHGTGGMALNSYDTAIALARAGFIVAAVTHTGDNYRDQSAAFTERDFVDRARHISGSSTSAGRLGRTRLDRPRTHRHVRPLRRRRHRADSRRRRRRHEPGGRVLPDRHPGLGLPSGPRARHRQQRGGPADLRARPEDRGDRHRGARRAHRLPAGRTGRGQGPGSAMGWRSG